MCPSSLKKCCMWGALGQEGMAASAAFYCFTNRAEKEGEKILLWNTRTAWKEKPESLNNMLGL